MSRCSDCGNSDCTCGYCFSCEEKQEEVDKLKEQLTKAVEVLTKISHCEIEVGLWKEPTYEAQLAREFLKTLEET